MNSITIQRIRTSDIQFPAVWALREKVLREPLGLSLKNENLSGEKNEDIVIALYNERVIGCLMLKTISTDFLKLRQMAVDPEFQGRGIGKRLVQEAELLAKEKGIKHIMLHARKTAVPFYEKSAYSILGTEFLELDIPHLLMEKKIE